MINDIPYDVGNVFNIDNPESWQCSPVWGASVNGNTPLLVRLKRDSENQYIKFLHPTYFSGNMLWKGANFRTSSKHELKKQIDYGFISARHHDNYRLYVVDNGSQPVKVIAQYSYLIRRSFTPQSCADDVLVDRISFGKRRSEAVLEKSFHYMQDNQHMEGWNQISVSQVLDHLSDGFRPLDILAMYEWMEPDDIRACLLFAQRAMRG